MIDEGLGGGVISELDLASALVQIVIDIAGLGLSLPEESGQATGLIVLEPPPAVSIRESVAGRI